jgi:hypothetical protein
MTPDTLRFLPRLTLITVVGGAVASIAFMLRAGRHQQSRILLLLFAIWVLSPFSSAVLAHVLSKRWTVLGRPALYFVTLVFALGSRSDLRACRLRALHYEGRFRISRRMVKILMRGAIGCRERLGGLLKYYSRQIGTSGW